jgi:hypothetical protein
MHFGGAMFFTDYSMSAMELARALEERGFESIWAPGLAYPALAQDAVSRGRRPAQTVL